jgi:hypothetical protein
MSATKLGASAPANDYTLRNNEDGSFDILRGTTVVQHFDAAGNITAMGGILALASSVTAVDAKVGRSKLVYFTRDVATAGTQAVTGVGFTPKTIIAFANKGSVALREMSIGFSDSGRVAANAFQLGVDGIGWSYSSTLVRLYASSGVYADAQVTSYDADGFTLTWSKTGSPTGTATGYALCLG